MYRRVFKTPKSDSSALEFHIKLPFDMINCLQMRLHPVAALEASKHRVSRWVLTYATRSMKSDVYSVKMFRNFIKLFDFLLKCLNSYLETRKDLILLLCSRFVQVVEKNLCLFELELVLPKITEICCLVLIWKYLRICLLIVLDASVFP